ncbi:serine hydrolase domain-containing protein [Pseudonocardia sp.]|jgi:CubicO group peptidase (beta-lactamase class C family)|uniref:serine hydrolase domain-containing protein n=1 Tax=Pseudonocardia sp. TaxID=60912 RepID=UPI0031FBAD0C
MTGDRTAAAQLADVLASGIENRVFSAAAWSVGGADGPLARGLLGTSRWGGPAVGEDSVWDLASVTKPVVGLVIMALVERGELALEQTLGSLLRGYAAGDKADLTVAQLMTHTSGLPGATPLWKTCPTRSELLAAIRDTPLPAEPGVRVEYSSQGFILLGLVAEAVGRQLLDTLVQDLVTAPAGMPETTYEADPARAVSTEFCEWRGHLVTGQVHDENAVVLGGACGHAGLFAPLADLERLGSRLVAGAPGMLEPETFTLMTTGHTDGLHLHRCLAWQGRDDVGSPVGTGPGPTSFGHTGFTGTSLWVDPELGRYFVLLTNRVHPSREGTGIAAVRREFHDIAAAMS